MGKFWPGTLADKIMVQEVPVNKEKFYPNSLRGLAVGDRVSMTNSCGDTTSVVICTLGNHNKFRNTSGTEYQVGYGGGWTISAVEFALPTADGVYMSDFGSRMTIVQLIEGVWYQADGVTPLDEVEILDLMPFTGLSTMNAALDSVSTVLNKMQIKRTYRGHDDDVANEIIVGLRNELAER